MRLVLVWRKLAPLLADHFTVLVPDMRGYGDSDKSEGGYDAEAEAADVLGLLDHFGIGQAHLVGHDMGAPVALAFSGLHPERTLSVAWIDEPLLGFDTERYTVFADWNHGGYWQFGFNATPGLAELMYAGREEAFLALIHSHMVQVKEAVTPDDVREQARGRKQPGGIAGWVGWYRAALETGSQLRQLAGRGAARCWRWPAQPAWRASSTRSGKPCLTPEAPTLRTAATSSPRSSRKNSRGCCATTSLKQLEPTFAEEPSP